MSSRFSFRLHFPALALLLITGSAAFPAVSYSAGLPAESGQRDASSHVIYVSPTGNDHNRGTHSSPVRTLTRARDIVRSIDENMSAKITVYLESGVYRLARPLVLGPKDSGTNGYNVVWTAAPRATAVISGGQRVSGWKLSNRSKDIWSAQVPKGLHTRQLYVNGTRATLASGRPPVKLKRTSKGYQASSSMLSHWRNAADISFVYIAQVGLMTEPVCPVGSIHGRLITMAEPCWDNTTKRVNNLVGYGTLGAPDFIENAFELLSKPGQFYLDQAAHLLYYIPRNGQNMGSADIEAPVLQSLVTGNGSASAPVHNISFTNLQFSDSTWLQPGTRDGFSDMQANYTVTGKGGYESEGLCHIAPHGRCPYGAWTKEPSSVQFSYDRNLTFSNDRFLHLGAAGLNLDNGSQNDTVSGSVFTDISGNGLEIGNVNMPKAAKASQTLGMRVVDNHVYGTPVEFLGGVGIDIGYVANSLISHNQIDHTPYTALSMGWGGWPDKRGQPATANFSHDNVVSDNLIFDFMQVLSDGGGVYTQGITGSSLRNGQKVTGNVIHDQLAWGRALQSDDGAAYVTYSKNVLYNDNYDWGSNHIDYSLHNGTDDPQLVKNNYWQQGDPNSSTKNVTVTDNTLITGRSQAPSGLVSSAGIQSGYRSVLSWHPRGNAVPNSPERVSVLYAFHGKAYVTWSPSFAAGNDSVSSYTVQSGSHSVTVSADRFDQNGFVIVPGLASGKSYSFAVTARSSDGSSTPSIASLPVKIASHGSSLPGLPKSVVVRAGTNEVKLVWYAPSSSRSQPVLSYVITDSRGQKFTVHGLRQLIVANNGGHVVDVLGGLSHSHAYTFSVAAVTPAGTGKFIAFPAVRPSS